MNRPLRAVGARLAVLGILAATANAACGSADDSSVVDVSATIDSLSMETGISHDSTESDLPLAGFDIDLADAETAKQRIFSLRLRNDGSADVRVFAEAGAGEVLIDSVPAGKMTRVDLETKAATIRLRSVDIRGEHVRSAEVSAGPDLVREVLVGGAGDTAPRN